MLRCRCMHGDCSHGRWVELTNPDGGSTVPIVHGPSDQPAVEEIEYGEPVPGVTCPSCGGGLVHTPSGAFCDWCSSYVPVIGHALVIDDDETGESDWTDPEDVS